MHDCVVLLAVSVGLRKIKSGPQQEMWFSFSVSLKRVFLLKLNWKQNIDLDYVSKQSGQSDSRLVSSGHEEINSILASLRETKNYWHYSIFVKVFLWLIHPVFSSKKKETSCRKPELLFQEILNVKKVPRWLSKFSHYGSENGEYQLKTSVDVVLVPDVCVYMWVTWGPILKISSTSKHG